MGDLPQALVDERHEPVERIAIARVMLFQEFGDDAPRGLHARHSRARPTRGQDLLSARKSEKRPKTATWRDVSPFSDLMSMRTVSARYCLLLLLTMSIVAVASAQRGSPIVSF